jgi:hypothetical protein
MSMIFDLVWAAIFIGVAVLVLFAKYRFGGKEKSFWTGLKSISTWVIAIVLSVIFRVVLLFVVMFYSLESKFENYYSDLTGKNNPRVVVKKPLVFASVGKPVYIGDSTQASSIQIGDTILPLASFNKGKGVTGEEYFLTERNGTQYWVSEKSLMSLFNYTYTNQPLRFTISEKDKAEEAWGNAKTYMDIYKKYHGSDITEELMNDTILYAEDYMNTGTQFLEIKKIPKGNGFDFSISGAMYKGKENCVVNGVEDRLGNKPRNDQACAYYITHGGFYKDTEK